MSTQNPQRTPKADTPEQRDDFSLDAQTVADLEPNDQTAAQVAGGRGTTACVLGGGAPVGTSDIRLKREIETISGALARLRLLGAG